MLTTPLFPVLRQPKCEACRGFAERLRTLDQPNWSMTYRLPGHHPDLEPTATRYGIPGSGFGQHFRCRGCGTVWDVSLLCDHGLERAVVHQTGTERQRASVHRGPWTDLVRLDGLPCRLTLTEYSFELQARVGLERIHADALEILERYPALDATGPMDVRVEGGLQCLRGVGLTDPPDRRGILRRVLPGAPIQPGRCTETWHRELHDALRERGRSRGATDLEVDSFELQTVGVYTLEIGGAELAVALSRLQLFLGDLSYSSSGFLEETDLPEPYIVWLFELLMAQPPVAELEEGWADLQRRGLVPTGAVPLCNVIPAFVNQARTTYAPREFRAWATLVLHAPGLHLFHDVEGGDGDVDGRCGGHVRDALWPSGTESR